jgi:CheY-like chemotaxis protein
MKKILVVEDMVDSIIPIIYFLEASEYTPKLAFDGNMAMKIAKEEVFDKVIVDWNMPILDGKNFLISLDKFLEKSNCTKNCTSYVIYTSTHPDEIEIPETKILKFVTIISKNSAMSDRVKQLNLFLEKS